MESTDKNNLPAPGAFYPLYPPPPEGGYPLYPQPDVGYPGPPPPANYQPSAPQRQFQQPQLVVANIQPTGTTPGFSLGAEPVSMTGAILLSCFVFWCCGWACGGIAFIVALVGQSSASGGNARGAIQLRNASYGLSIAGIVCGIIIIAIYVFAYVSEANEIASRRFTTTTIASKRCFNSYFNYYYDC